MANLFLIRDLCQSQNIPFGEFCKRIGKDESSVHSAIRRGSTKTETLEEISKVLGVQPGYFFDGYIHDRDLQRHQSELKHLRDLLDEKERTIQLLMEERKGKNER